MWRAFFLAIGVTLCVLGLECMVLDHAILASDDEPAESVAATVPAVDYGSYGYALDSPSHVDAEAKTIEPPEWAPWSLLSSGAIVLLYSVTRRVGTG